jgi:hypothetical protein
MTPPLDTRAEAARLFALQALGQEQAFHHFEPASADASFRRYFRLNIGRETYIVMDAPPDKENCQPFIDIALLLANAGLHAPRVLAHDVSEGYLLLTDLGSQTFLQGFQAGTAAPSFWMPQAISALVRWQAASQPDVLPPYDAAVLHRELNLFPDWYLAHHKQVLLNEQERADWQQLCDMLVTQLLTQPKAFVHRDYMGRNLMISHVQGVEAVGILDFQDALYGPISYDVASLFKDAFWSWTQAEIDGWLAQYRHEAALAGLPTFSSLDLDWMGLQRHLKVLGIFARIRYRDGKPHYLEDAPRFIRYVQEVIPRYPALAGLGRLFDKYVK